MKSIYADCRQGISQELHVLTPRNGEKVEEASETASRHENSFYEIVA